MIDIESLRLEIGRLVNSVVEKDHYWKKCYPCESKGICCVGADVLALYQELLEISQYVDADSSLMDHVIKKLEKNETCIFYDEDASGCLIHGVRPIICRITPFKGFVSDGYIDVFDIGDNPKCVSFKKALVQVDNTEGRLAHAGERVYFIVNNLFAGEPGECLTDFFRKKFLK